MPCKRVKDKSPSSSVDIEGEQGLQLEEEKTIEKNEDNEVDNEEKDNANGEIV